MKKIRQQIESSELLKRMQKFISINHENGCHEWTGGLRRGYGAMWDGLRTVGAHRIVLKAKIGRDLERSELACHSCDNQKCVNPDHLWLGSAKMNSDDRDKKGRRVITEKLRNVLRNKNAKGDKNNMAKLSDADVDVILFSGEKASVLAARFGVTRNHVYKIRNGVRWPHKDSV